ncbi:GntR family transcriptional regulator [Janibacter cremeus]|uniref:GntR family transcriptional regulator n=1 Tax=Janibacter cremeus TaxID=1285192 RepID=A0A852VVV0_9MICO|nr:GntR family transcriptional regulator [Janibacter cremeus]NYF97885.1 GntR family transcriptional regulator [Janibacter cremeus]
MTSQTPAKFRRIAGDFRTRILSGELRAGDEVPSERALATQYDVSRPTATKALALLRTEGFLTSVQGSGTFVADLNVSRRPRDRYARAKRAGRIYSGNERAEIVAAEVVEHPPSHVARGLALPESTAAIRRRRITWDGEERTEVSTSWFSAELAAPAPRLLSTERIRAGTVAYVEEQTGRTAEYARDRMTARAAGDQDARDLGLKDSSTPVLLVEHTVYDEADFPIEFAEAIYPPGRFTAEQRYSLS